MKKETRDHIVKGLSFNQPLLLSQGGLVLHGSQDDVVAFANLLKKAVANSVSSNVGGAGGVLQAPTVLNRAELVGLLSERKPGDEAVVLTLVSKPINEVLFNECGV